jgi:cytochrome c-type biogenesis protein
VPKVPPLAAALVVVLALVAAGTWAVLGPVGGAANRSEVVRLGQGGDRTEPDHPVEAGGDLSSLSFQDLGGTTTDLAELVGRPMVINFFGSWCPPCLVEMPAFERVHRDLGDQVLFLGLAVRDRPEDVRRIVADTGVTYRIGRDVDDRVLLAVGGVRMPTTAFVDAEGTLVRVRLGELTEDELRALIAEHLGVRG